MAQSRSSSTKRTTFKADSQAHNEQAAYQGGLGDAFGKAGTLLPQVQALQQALLAGMVRGQRREAQRLAARHGDADPRIAAALQRAEQLSAVQIDLARQTQLLAQVTETFGHDGIFHGYVALSDGAPAVGYTVRLALAATGNRQAWRGSDKTDAGGYFRIEVGTQSETPAGGGALEHFTTHLARMVGVPLTESADTAPAMSASSTATAGAASDAAANATSAVAVLDGQGRTVLEDPMPPSFDPVGSEFRYYVVESSASASRGSRSK